MQLVIKLWHLLTMFVDRSKGLQTSGTYFRLVTRRGRKHCPILFVAKDTNCALGRFSQEYGVLLVMEATYRKGVKQGNKPRKSSRYCFKPTSKRIRQNIKKTSHDGGPSGPRREASCAPGVSRPPGTYLRRPLRGSKPGFF